MTERTPDLQRRLREMAEELEREGAPPGIGVDTARHAQTRERAKTCRAAAQSLTDSEAERDKARQEAADWRLSFETANEAIGKQDEVIATLRAALVIHPEWDELRETYVEYQARINSGPPDAARENGKLEAVPEPADQDDYTGHYLVGVIDNIDIGCTLQQIRGGLIDLLKRRNKRQREASGDAAREDQP